MKRLMLILFAITTMIMPNMVYAQNQITRPVQKTEKKENHKNTVIQANNNHKQRKNSNTSNMSLPMTEEETYNFWFECYPNNKKMTKAIDILKKAHEKGNSYASKWIGLYYFHGWNINSDSEYTILKESNNKEAVKWLQISVDNGNTSSYDLLAQCYYYGHGVPKDINKVTELMEKAIADGDKNAEKQLNYYKKNFKYE